MRRSQRSATGSTNGDRGEGSPARPIGSFNSDRSLRRAVRPRDYPPIPTPSTSRLPTTDLPRETLGGPLIIVQSVRMSTIEYASAITHPTTKLWLKFSLLSSGLLSLAQLVVAIWLKLSPLTFSIDVLTSPNHRFLNDLPTLASVTTQLLNIWLGAATALAGLWMWERRLSRGPASHGEMAAWGGLVSAQSSIVLFSWRRLGLVVATVYFCVFGLVIAASSAVISAVTPVGIEVTEPGWYSVPTLIDGSGVEYHPHNAFDSVDFRNVISDAISSTPNVNNLSSISVGGAVVNTSDLGVANPAILESFTGNSTWRGSRFSSQNSFVEASLCMSGVVAEPSCQLAGTPVAVNVVEAVDGAANIITLSYTDACGQPVTSDPQFRFRPGVAYANTCNQNGTSFLNWVTTGALAGNRTDSFPWTASSRQFNCPISLAPSVQPMRIYRRNGQTGIERVPPDDASVQSCSAANLTLSLTNVSIILDSFVEAALTPASDKSDFQAVVTGAAFANATLGTFAGNDAFGAGLAIASGLAYRAAYTSQVVIGFSHDAQANVVNYRGNDSVGVVVPTEETYTVTALGHDGRLLLVPLFGAIVVVAASLGLVVRPVGVFDPSDAEAVARTVEGAMRSGSMSLLGKEALGVGERVEAGYKQLGEVETGSGFEIGAFEGSSAGGLAGR